jgi:hypothetical protein
MLFKLLLTRTVYGLDTVKERVTAGETAPMQNGRVNIPDYADHETTSADYVNMADTALTWQYNFI